jgi:hypothetical protein
MGKHWPVIAGQQAPKGTVRAKFGERLSACTRLTPPPRVRRGMYVIRRLRLAAWEADNPRGQRSEIKSGEVARCAGCCVLPLCAGLVATGPAQCAARGSACWLQPPSFSRPLPPLLCGLLERMESRLQLPTRRVRWGPWSLSPGTPIIVPRQASGGWVVGPNPLP